MCCNIQFYSVKQRKEKKNVHSVLYFRLYIVLKIYKFATKEIELKYRFG